MRHVLLRVRARTEPEDLDVDEVRRRLAQATSWRCEVDDTRLSDAPFVSVIAGTDVIDDASTETLRAALADLERMRVTVWSGSGQESPLESATAEALGAASRAFERVRST
ncbi:MAG TPA: hypothetical protein VHJ34_00960 [Actinomycetota bacterium]|nr:hypothetical protein [Actinomycetota bacterium]